MENNLDSNRKKARAYVLGGGVMGLGAADQLLRAGYEVILFEADKKLGGLAGMTILGGFQIEKHYHFVYWGDEKNIQNFFITNGAGGTINWRTLKNALWYQGKLQSIDNPVAILLSSMFKVTDKINFIKAFFKIHLTKKKDLAGIRAIDWLKKTFSSRLYHILWEPLLNMKFQEDKETLAADWIFTRLKYHTASKRPFNFGLTFGFITDTYQPLFEKITERITQQGRVHTGTPVKRIQIENGYVTAIKTPTGLCVVEPTEPVLSCVPLPILSQILSGAPQAVSKILALYQMLDVIDICFLADRSISPYFWTNIGDDQAPFTVVIEFSRLTGTERFGGKHLIYLSRYHKKTNNEQAERSDEAIKDIYFQYLKKIFPCFNEKSVIAWQVTKSQNAAPSFFEDYIHNLPPRHFSEIENLYIGSASHIYPLDRGTGNSIRIGADLVQRYIQETTVRNQ